MSENNILFKILSCNDRYEQEFKEETLLGEGCFGSVCKVLHSKENRYYAIKKIDFNEHYVNKTCQKFKDECLKEIQLMGSLQNNYGVGYIQSWSEYEDMLYIQMELCETDLNHILQQLRKEFKRNPFETSSSIKYYISSELFKETVEALNYLHSQNPQIIHRDLKPANILITNGLNGRFVKLGDFGLAVFHNFNEETHIQYRGTLAYMAPEVKNGRHYDTRADVYSLGLIARKIFNSSSIISIDDELLYEKYESVQNLIKKMTSKEEEIEKRPNCQQILDSEKSWYFNIEILNNDSIYKNIIGSKLDQSMKDSFLEYFIRTKHSKRTGESVNELLRSSNQTETSYELELFRCPLGERDSRQVFISNEKQDYANEKIELNRHYFIKASEILKEIFMETLEKHSKSTLEGIYKLAYGQNEAAAKFGEYYTSPPLIPLNYEMVDILLKSNKSGIEQQEPRKKFLKNLYDLCEEVELNDAFMEGLKKHSNYEYIEDVLKYDNEMAQKTFIFLEFTRERGNCNEMVEILLKSGQKEAANLLESYNTFAPFIPISYEIELPITPATFLRSGGPKYFPMSQKPRGMCIIINNVKDVLGKESLRFQNIFEQLSFVVKLWYDLSATEMEERLIELSKENRLSVDNALIVMTISLGDHEKIIGTDGSELRIRKIVDIFSKANCKALSMKPKLFFFNCCRIKDGNVAVTATKYPKQNKIITELETIDQNWINKNRSTLICSTCAKDYNFWFIPNQLTFFGQALSHCIAQYSCEESVESILKYTSERMSKIGSPEIFWCQMTREIYFNPGLPLDNKQLFKF